MSDGPQGTDWDYEENLARDEDFERGLVPKELCVLLLVLIVLAIRIFLG